MLIHMLRNMLTNMFVSNTTRWLDPALLNTNIAIRRAMSCLDNAAAMVKPPKSSMITGVHIELKTTVVASFGPKRLYGFSSDFIIPSSTTRNGISNEVTKSGIT